MKYDNLFPGFHDALKAEKYLTELLKVPIAASKGPSKPNTERNIVEEMNAAEAAGNTLYSCCKIP